MGRESTQQTTPDLFSTDQVREASAASIKSGSDRAARVPTASQRHVLPENLDRAVKQLNDDELIHLIEVALKEAKRRGKPLLQTDARSMQSSHQSEGVTQKQRSIEKASSKKQVEDSSVTLSPGKLNAVRAAFKAGVTPARIARQFGVSQKNVRKALASESDDRKQ
jgi:DNA-directed RNA polymerase specialized sigma24 family protein